MDGDCRFQHNSWNQKAPARASAMGLMGEDFTRTGQQLEVSLVHRRLIPLAFAALLRDIYSIPQESKKHPATNRAMLGSIGVSVFSDCG